MTPSRRPLMVAERRVRSGPPPSVTKPPAITDREHVWRQLDDAWTRPEPALLLGLGRRRAGKSFVLSRFADAVGGVYYQATRRTEAEQLAALSRAVGERFADPALQAGVAFPTWEELFTYLVGRAAGAPFLLILDEFPFLVDAAPALPSIVQQAWDHTFPGTRARLVLNGSHISAMRQLEAHDQPLYGRRTGRLLFPAFDVRDVAAFVPSYGALDRIRTWAIVGGLPGNLALLRDDDDLATNVQRLVLDPSGRLADDAEHVLDAFLGDAEVHYSVLQAIARGDTTWSRITSRLGKPGGSLSRPLRWLEEMELVARVVPISEDARTSRRAVYRLTDPYLAFWHRFVSPLVARGETSLVEPAALWRSRVLPTLDGYLGGAFEEVCRDWIGQTDAAPFPVARVGAWWDATSSHEIDVVALGFDSDVLVGECKWGAVRDDDLQRLRDRIPRLLAELPASFRGARVRVACFSAKGEWGAGVRRAIDAGDVLGFTAEDVVSSGPR